MLSTPWATNFAHSPHGDVIILPWPGSKHAKLPRETYENDHSWKITTALSWIPPHSCPFLFPIFIVRCMKLPFFYSFYFTLFEKNIVSFSYFFLLHLLFFFLFFCFYKLRDNFSIIFRVLFIGKNCSNSVFYYISVFCIFFFSFKYSKM